MNFHIIVDYQSHVYLCKHCGVKSEPPWMTPPPDIAQEAREHFISQHKDCKSHSFGTKAETNVKLDHAN